MVSVLSKILFICFWLYWILVAARASLQLHAVLRLTAVASLVEQGHACARASVAAAPGLQSSGSVVLAHGLGCSWHVGSSRIRD